MILLGIETATDMVGVSVAVHGDVRASIAVAGRRRHAESLAPAIDQVLSHAGTSLQALDAIVVDIGPGLFTGLRVGVAMAKGLAQGLGVGIVAVTSLEALARAAADAGWRGRVLPVVDARRSEVFSAGYDSPGREQLTETSPPTRWRPEDLATSLVAGAADGLPLLAVGDGARRYRELFEGVAGVAVAEATLESAVPSALVALAAERLSAGGALLGPDEIEPLYLRDADARINWVQRRPVAT